MEPLSGPDWPVGHIFPSPAVHDLSFVLNEFDVRKHIAIVSHLRETEVDCYSSPTEIVAATFWLRWIFVRRLLCKM